jgi:predicted nucleic acid-binding Zn ribbon protein
MADQPEKIPQHRHCRNCGKAFVGEGEFCGDECRDTAGKGAKKKIRTLLIAWLIIVAATAAAVAIYYMA